MVEAVLNREIAQQVEAPNRRKRPSSNSSFLPAGPVLYYVLQEMNALDALARKDRHRKVICAIIACFIVALSTLIVEGATEDRSPFVWCSVPIAGVFSLVSYSTCERRMESICGAFLFGLVHCAAFSMGYRLVLGYHTGWIGPLVGIAVGASGGMAVGSIFGAFRRII